MISFYNIWSIAIYETKTLVRSWFFRIFAILSLLFLFFFNLMLQTEIESIQWDFIAIPAAIPYANILMLNVAQAIIAVFLASEFLKRDKKLDTTDVIYMRSMTNSDYVIGKTLGNIFVFLVINISVLFLTIIFNLISPESGIDIPAYFYYLFLISIPTLIFILGLSFFTMSIVRNQAVTFILLLGYIAVTLFYLKGKVFYLFDYMAFNIPMLKSEFVGFGNIKDILIHRGIYFSLGMGFICMTIYLLKRLPQSKSMTWLSLFVAIISVSFGLYLGSKHVNRFLKNKTNREEYIAVNNKWASKDYACIIQHHIKLRHQEGIIKSTSNITLLNTNTSNISEIILCLNPSLEVESVENNGKTVPFTRELHIIKIIPENEIIPNDSISLTLIYQGKIDESFCYLDIDEETLHEKYGPAMFNIDKRYGFISPDFVLLTPETCWYPVSGVTYSTANPEWYHQDFIHFTLEVKTRKGLLPVSQGLEEKTTDGTRFVPEYPLTGISLAIADYAKKSIEIDSIQFNIIFKRGHDYFSNALPEVTDTVTDVIRERLHDYQRKINLKYPFHRFNIVEVPVQFISYNHIWIGGFETVQPEIVFFPEKGMAVQEADLKGRFQRYKRWSKWSKEKSTDKEYAIRALNNFCSVFTKELGRPDWSNSKRGQSQPREMPNPFNIYANFFNFANFLESEKWPIINRILEAYLRNVSSDQQNTWMRQYSGISEDERANIAMQEKSFSELLGDPEQKQIIDNIIKLKGDVLFSIIRTRAGQEDFDNFVYSMLLDNRHRKIKFVDFNQKLKDRFNLNLEQFLENWFNSTEMPGFIFGAVSAEKVRVDEQIKTMVKFKVTNPENTSGIIKIIFRMRQQSGNRFAGSSSGKNNLVQKVLFLEAYQTKEISYLLEDDPRSVIFNTLTSKNIPVLIENTFSEIEENKKVVAFEGERVVEDPVNNITGYEIIVDNEDTNFTVLQPETKGLLVKWLLTTDINEDKYSGFRTWRAPINWTPTTSSAFYGKYIRSAHYIRSGTGDRKAVWKAPISISNFYDVYYYLDYQQQNQYNKGGEPGQYQFIIHHDNGTDEPLLSLKNARQGWNHLGTYYFSGDTAVIELTNKCKGRIVVADAVKLVEQ